jgi:curli biogenesis system outer membrane secretion channel CsgG
MKKTAKIAAAFCAAGLLGLAAAHAEGNLRYSITVTKFANEAGWSGRWDVGDGFTTIMTDALQQNGKFIVLGDSEMRQEAMKEQDLAASGRMAGGNKAPQVGRMTPAQLLVRGSITHVQDETTGGSGGLSFKGISIGGSKGKAEVNITIYLVDSETGQVKASQKVVGQAGRRGLGVGYHGSALGGLGGNLEGFKNDNVGKACEDAVVQCVEFLEKQLESIPWEASIMLAAPTSWSSTAARAKACPSARNSRSARPRNWSIRTPRSARRRNQDPRHHEVTRPRKRFLLHPGGRAEKGMSVLPAN